VIGRCSAGGLENVVASLVEFIRETLFLEFWKVELSITEILDFSWPLKRGVLFTDGGRFGLGEVLQFAFPGSLECGNDWTANGIGLLFGMPVAPAWCFWLLNNVGAVDDTGGYSVIGSFDSIVFAVVWRLNDENGVGLLPDKGGYAVAGDWLIEVDFVKDAETLVDENGVGLLLDRGGYVVEPDWIVELSIISGVETFEFENDENGDGLLLDRGGYAVDGGSLFELVFGTFKDEKGVGLLLDNGGYVVDGGWLFVIALFDGACTFEDENGVGLLVDSGG
jgi:hypothetical protein